MTLPPIFFLFTFLINEFYENTIFFLRNDETTDVKTHIEWHLNKLNYFTIATFTKENPQQNSDSIHEWLIAEKNVKYMPVAELFMLTKMAI